MTRRTLQRCSLLVAASLLTFAGCVRRELQIHSDPPGALVFLNDQEVGRTPVTRPFTFYGTYDVVVRMEGYETLKTRKLVLAPWWQWVPIDLAAELLPLTDRQKVTFTLQPTTAPSSDPADPATLLGRAADLRTRLPETRPAPATRP